MIYDRAVSWQFYEGLHAEGNYENLDQYNRPSGRYKDSCNVHRYTDAL